MRIYSLCATEIGVDLTRFLSAHIPITGVIGLSRREPGDAISGYVYLKEFAAEIGASFHPVQTYALTAEQDKKCLSELDIDLLLVTSWQRLVPDWLIEKSRYGVIGSHGSPQGISGGRGRSPINWSILLGASEFLISIFFIDRGIDTGDVIASSVFQITEDDDIQSCYHKCCLLVGEMILSALSDGRIASRSAHSQPVDGHYLPQRLPSDGAIDWSRSAVQVCAFVRALTRPYPGAFSTIGGSRVKIWRCRPFSIAGIATGTPPGQIVMKYHDGSLVVTCGSGLVLIDSFSVDAGMDLRRGNIFESVDFVAQMKEIASRHMERYPELPLSPLILTEARLVTGSERCA